MSELERIKRWLERAGTVLATKLQPGPARDSSDERPLAQDARRRVHVLVLEAELEKLRSRQSRKYT